jgi:hypothetical protein
VGEFLDLGICVAADAVHIFMDRTGKLLVVHIHGNRPALAFGSQLGVGVTGFAVFIGLGKGRCGPHEKGKNDTKKNMLERFFSLQFSLSLYSKSINDQG